MNQRPPTGSAPDPIGRASARLFAAGVEREQRMLTLRFLGILLETADAEGHVHCDPDDLVGLGLLHGLDSEEVARSRALLETFDVLDREPTGWLIKDFAPVGDEVPPAEVMAAIGRAMGRPIVEEGAAPAPRAQVVRLEPAPTRMARRWIVAPVGAVAAAAVLLVALMVSGQVRTPLVSQPASNGHETAVGAGTTESSSAPGAAQAQGSSANPSSPSPSAGSATAPSLAQTPAGSAPVGAGGPSSTQAVCPAGNVSATVDRMDQHLDSSVPSSSRVNASLPPVVHTSVTGSVKNNSASTVVVNPFPVTVNFTDPAGKTSETVTATALAGPTPVGPGAQVPWSVTVENPHDAPVPGTANAAPPTWRWDDAKLAAACPR